MTSYDITITWRFAGVQRTGLAHGPETTSITTNAADLAEAIRQARLAADLVMQIIASTIDISITDDQGTRLFNETGRRDD